ncbi:MAG TPA: zf-TFIIB domain-containing protein [Thermoanaerobaculia bacterium]|nr:zf-TFIIB domain-containing protein [Thermoanaerobaculia bacterium]
MNCPVCHVPLIAVERDRIEVDSCISCHGLWFDHGELDLLCERTGTAIDSAALFTPAVSNERLRKCPRCTKKMEQVALTEDLSMITDHCPEDHGIWFDARELGTLIDHAAAARGGSRPVGHFLGEVFGKDSS